MIPFCYLLIHPKATVLIAFIIVPLISKAMVTHIRIIGSQCQIPETVKPGIMDFFRLIPEFFYPLRRQMLRHNVLNRICAIGKQRRNIFYFLCFIILEALEQICFILAPHLIDGLIRQYGLKFLIIWEAPTLPL